MKLDADAIIARDKVVNYLLEWRPENDKSQFLTLAGYTVAQPDRLVNDIRNQLLPLDAQAEEMTEYGEKYRISGTLVGPNGRALRVETVWMVESGSGVTKFTTLYPTKGV
jgi:hypothetical protein